MKTTRYVHLTFLCLIFLVVLFRPIPLQAESQQPKLILQITVDQLRGDLPTRYYERLGDGGIRYLWENGTVYTNAHHSHANNETIVGHATLATGATPAAHGMIGNVWLDRTTGETVYNIEDARYRLLTPGSDVDRSTEIDPTQRAARSEGRSPSAILVSTFGDELKAHSNGLSKVFAVSVKDRGAVSLAGHAGTAYWFSKASGKFVTSSYYMDQYPEWVDAWNNLNHPMRYADTEWQLMHRQDSYLFGESDDREWETELAGFGRIFPHPYGSADSPYFNTLLTLSPAGDELVLDFAKAVIENEALGRDDVVDFLGVSFSSTDYVGHIFGPSSLEGEDNILRLDQTIAALLTYVDETVGLDNTLIVLSADHGGPDTPGYSNSLGLQGGYIDPASWDRDSAIDRIKEAFSIEGKLIENYEHPYVYLAPEIATRKDSEREAIERAVVQELARMPGVSTAISSRSLEYGNVPDTEMTRAVLKNFNAKRSGDVYVVFEPNWFINDFDGLVVASTHGSPWRYDSFVPIVFSGPGILPKNVSRRVHTVDIALTLSKLFQTKPPSGASGKVLTEVLEESTN
ncbi:MAG: putative AlkP superfamily pyrophosphatase or phosphodiesterase [Woeseiaceae bacterium]|jgi:predicted AlkP superfamily pyrophosphatase or phosphodiesterase